MLLLDTNIVLWLAREPEMLSASARKALAMAEDNGEPLFIAGITLFEISMLAAKGKLVFITPVERLLEHVESVYRVLPINWRIAMQAMRFSASYPKDPADRQIGATALIHGLALVTSDGLIRKSGEVPCIW